MNILFLAQFFRNLNKNNSVAAGLLSYPDVDVWKLITLSQSLLIEMHPLKTTFRSKDTLGHSADFLIPSSESSLVMMHY